MLTYSMSYKRTLALVREVLSVTEGTNHRTMSVAEQCNNERYNNESN